MAKLIERALPDPDMSLMGEEYVAPQEMRLKRV